MHFSRRLLQLFVGLAAYGFAIALMVRAAIGVAPWDVLSQGLVRHTGLTFGTVVLVTSFVVLLLWIPLRQRPRFGTIANALLIGPIADLGLRVLPQQTEWWAQGLTFAGGLLLLAVASGLYIGADFGPGPRDGLMLGLHARLGWRVGVARTVIEVTVLAAGWLLGGQVGIGTVAEALLIGPLVSLTLPLFAVAPRASSTPLAPPAPAPPSTLPSQCATDSAETTPTRR
ncbi:YczE/YyaS/YitT family protein [Frigoribacterium sp. 2-23]|uniref:membrane protein YczE n=1 Tax=Frigoribacterium sp. 2-23 TaxID=3415006 RepID=UPI003C700E78